MRELGLSFEPPEHMRQRLAREKLQLQHQLEQERLEKQHQRDTAREETGHQRRIFWSVFAVVILTGVVSLWVGLFDASMADETKAWARTTASAIIAGVFGYFSGMGLTLKR